MTRAEVFEVAYRHGRRLVHSHRYHGRHRHLILPWLSEPVDSARAAGAARRDPDAHSHEHGHGHSHGLIDQSIKRSREGIQAVSLSLAVLGLAALAQAAVFVASGSVALLADVIHNFGDALTALPLGVAFALRSQVAEQRAGLAVVTAIFISACVAAIAAVNRLIHPAAPIADPLIGLAITLVIARITWESWRTVRGHEHHHGHEH